MITLVLGGARSGKSELAERLVARLPLPITYVATGVASDPDIAARIAAHRSRRPATWATVEPADLVAAVAEVTGTLLVDALGTWVASADGFAVDVDGLLAALIGRTGDTIVVSEEVGLGVHPSTEAGRRFRDALGVVNGRVAEVAGDVLLVVAGRALRLDRV
jgi:adenosyl cobinamide kinase/adenosyl cobinamide phosphate guanylyltransferase